MSTVYEEIAQKAVDWSKRFHDHRADCAVFAKAIARDYLAYLGAPAEAMQFVELDRELKATEEHGPLHDVPRMTLGKDGYQYFGLSVLYRTTKAAHRMTERTAVGLRKGAAQWQVMWNDTRYGIPFTDLSKLNVLFDAWTKTSRQMYEGPVTGNSTSIGFVPSVSDGR